MTESATAMRVQRDMYEVGLVIVLALWLSWLAIPIWLAAFVAVRVIGGFIAGRAEAKR